MESLTQKLKHTASHVRAFARHLLRYTLGPSRREDHTLESLLPKPHLVLSPQHLHYFDFPLVSDSINVDFSPLCPPVSLPPMALSPLPGQPLLDLCSLGLSVSLSQFPVTQNCPKKRKAVSGLGRSPDLVSSAARRAPDALSQMDGLTWVLRWLH